MPYDAASTEEKEEEEALLRLYNGTNLLSSRDKPARGKAASSAARKRAQRTKGLPKELRKVYHGCKAGKLHRDWDVACHGGLTHRTVVCIAAQRANAFQERKRAASSPEYTNGTQRADHQHQEQPASLAEPILVGALLQAREILREKARGIDICLADAIAVLQCAARKGTRALLKEADNLWRLSNLSSEEGHRELLTCEAKIKSNLAGELSKAVSASSPSVRGTNPGSICKDLQAALRAVLDDLVRV